MIDSRKFMTLTLVIIMMIIAYTSLIYKNTRTTHKVKFVNKHVELPSHPIKIYPDTTYATREEQSERSHPQKSLAEKAKDSLMNVCGAYLFNHSLMFYQQTVPNALSTVYLLIILNSPHWESVRIVDGLYRPFFYDITYCSLPGNATLRKNLVEDGYSIITYTHPPGSGSDIKNGYLTYSCWMELLKHIDLDKMEVKGIMLLGDDVLIIPERLQSLNQDLIWRVKHNDEIFDLKQGRSCRNGKCTFRPRWVWFGIKHYQQEYSAALRHLRSLAQLHLEPYEACYKNLVNITGADMRILGGHNTDVYYLPKRYVGPFSIIAQRVFLPHNAFVEAVSTTVATCLEHSPEQSLNLYVHNVQNRERNFPWKNYMNFYHNLQLLHHAYHPAKWSKLVVTGSQSNHRQFLCERVLPDLHPLRSKLHNVTLK